MYQNPVIPLTVPAGAVSIGGFYSQQWVWFTLGAFAILAVVMALGRIIPRNGEL
jgi:hypothetical protein